MTYPKDANKIRQAKKRMAEDERKWGDRLIFGLIGLAILLVFAGSGALSMLGLL